MFLLVFTTVTSFSSVWLDLHRTFSGNTLSWSRVIISHSIKNRVLVPLDDIHVQLELIWDTRRGDVIRSIVAFKRRVFDGVVLFVMFSGLWRHDVKLYNKFRESWCSMCRHTTSTFTRQSSLTRHEIYDLTVSRRAFNTVIVPVEDVHVHPRHTLGGRLR